MSSSMLMGTIIAVSLAALAGWLIFLQRKASLAESKKVDNSKMLQLQALERLTLLTDRIALPNIIGRVNVPGYSVRDMQQAITQAIREEFEYNITQQIYVSAEAWSAVKNLKDQNMLIVNQLASTMPANATGLDLCKLLLEYLMNDKKGNLHEVVSEVLSYEAKKLL